MKHFFTSHYHHFRVLFLTFLLCGSAILHAQTVVTVPSANDNEGSEHQPYGCFDGYERTEMLYLSSEINESGYITEVGFYVNALSNPAASTPVVIKMATTSSSTLSVATYADASASATTVWTGNITNDMLSEDNWVIVTLGTQFEYLSNNLLVFVETNFGNYGGEVSYYAKEFRHSNAGGNLCQLCV